MRVNCEGCDESVGKNTPRELFTWPLEVIEIYRRKEDGITREKEVVGEEGRTNKKKLTRTAGGSVQRDELPAAPEPGRRVGVQGSPVMACAMQQRASRAAALALPCKRDDDGGS
eukprot:756936-Hanusia_phi.AAC.4